MLFMHSTQVLGRGPSASQHCESFREPRRDGEGGGVGLCDRTGFRVQEKSCVTFIFSEKSTYAESAYAVTILERRFYFTRVPSFISHTFFFVVFLLT